MKWPWVSRKRPAVDNTRASENAPTSEMSQTSTKTFPSGIKLLYNGENSIVECVALFIFIARPPLDLDVADLA